MDERVIQSQAIMEMMAKIQTPYWDTLAPLKKGDRVRIKEGYDGAGETWFYVGKSVDCEGKVLIIDDMEHVGNPNPTEWVLAEAIEPYPYTREERIERAIEDFWTALALAVDREKCLSVDDRALLFAILDAGV